MIYITDPTPPPPLQGRGVPHGVPAAGKAVAAPLPCRGGVGVGSVTMLICTNLFFYHYLNEILAMTVQR